MSKALTAIFALIFCVSATPVKQAPYAHDASLIVPVICDGGNGTAFKIGFDAYLTAAHVSSIGGCKIAGQPIVVAHSDSARDYAIVRGPSGKGFFPRLCSGFKPEQVYLARGYVFPLGLLALPWRATEINDGPRRLFFGDGIPGMSGGPAIDRKGRVVGIVTHRFAARALPLSQTKVCP